MTLLTIRALRLKAPKIEPKEVSKITFDEEKAIRDLGEMIKCKTVSYRDRSLEDDAEFEKLYAYLEKAFPNIYANTELTKIENRGLLFRWKGKSPDSPSVLMSHFDVVPADDDKWDHPPYSAEIVDGVMYGRGTIDTKITMNAVLQAVEHNIQKGFIPENDVYLAFSGSEETSGPHAIKIVDILESKKLTPKLVLDEGGAVTEKVFPGVNVPCAMVGIAEKGMVNLKYTVKSTGGHASAPKPKTPITTLAKACTRVHKHPFKARLVKPVKDMLETMGKYSDKFLIKLLCGNLWLFKGLLGFVGKKIGGNINAIMRTTTAFTTMKGADALNVIPTEAYLTSNHRILPGETMQSTLEYVQKIVNDKNINVEIVYGQEPSTISKYENSLGYENIKNTIQEIWPGLPVAPYLMVAATDSRHQCRISDNVYRFSPIHLNKEEVTLMHSHNERISLENIIKSTEFYLRLIEKL